MIAVLKDVNLKPELVGDICVGKLKSNLLYEIFSGVIMALLTKMYSFYLQYPQLKGMCLES